ERQTQQLMASVFKTSSVNLDAVEGAADTFLAKTIQNMEVRMDEKETAEIAFSVDTTAPGVSDAQVRVFKAKLRIMQEELDQLTSEYYKKDDENIRLNTKMKELEEDRARLQKSQSILQTQLEKHKALAEESAKKCDGLQLYVAGLNKEIENLNRSNKQAAALHNTIEIRLNRATEESQKLKSEINKMKQINKDKVNEEHESKETLLAENKSLKKQKAELIVAFKKQLKIIDILKRQKMHFEAAKLLSFTEEEFVKALDWGGSF
uniref:Testis expressed 9 n=1 Tax=Neogobius melanostomus TaxID=47308 RepID=A0A8C6WVJ3_9GOBI